jgi:hypothetical protein
MVVVVVSSDVTRKHWVIRVSGVRTGIRYDRKIIRKGCDPSPPLHSLSDRRHMKIELEAVTHDSLQIEKHSS